MITPKDLQEALAWLSDLPNRPDLSPSSDVGRAWMARLVTELRDVGATGASLVAACRAIARRHNQFHPTPGQIAAEVGQRLVDAAKTRRETEWRDRQIDYDPTIQNESPGWSNGRSLSGDLAKVVDLVRRGHAGRLKGEGYMAAILREEREQADAEARGERYLLKRYGPSLEANPYIGRELAR